MVANPLPPDEQLDPALHDRVLAQALAGADAEGVHGKDTTPYLLARFHHDTDGRSLEVNTRIILRNAALAAQIAVAHATGEPAAVSGAPVLVIGDVMTDVVARVDDPLALGSDTAAHVQTHQGGAGANVAAWLAALDVPVRFVGRVGADPFGTESVQVLRTGGVDVRVAVDDARATGTVVVLVGADGERTMLPDAGANSALTADDVAAGDVATAGWLHVSGYTLLNPGSRDAGSAALAAARAAGVPTRSTSRAPRRCRRWAARSSCA